MRRILWFIGIAAAALLAAVAVFVAATLPERAASLPAGAVESRLVWGAFHVHSTRSDGSASLEQIAAAAARAGLHFVILTDHGDATRLEPPQVLHGVLMIDAVEISTETGHVVALNLQRPSPFPLAGEARDVVDDIHRLGGWAVAAHPESPRQALRWRQEAGEIDGFEWLNVDSEWRARTAAELAAVALRSMIRPPEAIASLLREAPRLLERWDARPSRRALFSIAALDAHARMPGYEPLFRAVAQAVSLSRPLTGDAAADAAAVLAGIGSGQSFSVVRGQVDGLGPVEFRAASADASVSLSGTLPSTGPVRFEAKIPAAPRVELVLLRNGRRVASGTGELRFDAGSQPGRYRLLAFVGGTPVPWITTNSIEVDGDRDQETRPPPAAAAASPDAGATIPESWQVEKDSTSTATLETNPSGNVFRYQLGGGSAAGQYAAMVAAAGAEPIERIEFMGQSTRPMRASLQVRTSGAAGERRWRKSIYLDETPRQIVIRLAELEPVDRGSLRPVVARVHSVLLVVDTVNTLPGTSGAVTVRQARFIRGAADAGSRTPRP